MTSKQFIKFIEKNFLSNPNVTVRTDGNQRVIFQDNKVKFGYSNIMPNINDDILHEICHILLCKESELKDLMFGESQDGDLEFAVHALSDRIHELTKHTQDITSIKADEFSLKCNYPNLTLEEFKEKQVKYKNMLKYVTLARIVESFNQRIDSIINNKL